MFAKRSLLLTAALLLVLASCAPTPETFGAGESNNTGGSGPPPGKGTDASPPGGAVEEESLPPAMEGLPQRPWVNFASDEYKFSLEYPPGFTVEPKSADDLSNLTPSPVAAFEFLSPELASSDTPELEPPDLDLRVFDAQGAVSLEGWLNSVDLMNSDSDEEFQTEKISGLEICSSTMIFPGCSYFFFGNGWAYQLTPASLVGEAMVNTFSLLP